MEQLTIGACAEVKRVYHRDDIRQFSELAGRRGNVKLDVVPGALIGALFSYLLGTKLPGQGTIYLKQRMKFLDEAWTGEELTGRVEIVNMRPEKGLITLRTVCLNSAGNLICDGEALVMAKRS